MREVYANCETGAATHVGMVRSRNEDSYLIRPEAGIWAVADGMGGHEDGDFASHTVVEALKSIHAATSASELLTLCENRIFEANSSLKEVGRQRGGIIIGTTVAVLLVFNGCYACVWSGDSRIYIIHQGKITQISRDHTEVQDLLARGVITPEEAETWSGSNAITRAIGVIDLPELEVSSGPINRGDLFVMCTDGLTRHVEDREILQCVTAKIPQEACEQLIMLTLERGAVDNVTVVVVQCGPECALRPDADTGPPVIPDSVK
jgi:serine/threonine protein phosphatase PrpC